MGYAWPMGSNPREPDEFASNVAALLGGMREAVGMPMFVLGISFLGFGALLQHSDWPLWVGLLSTFSTWALPGQIAMVEFYEIGGGALVVGLAVALTNARLLPMVVSLLPVIRHPRWPAWTHFPISHWIAVTGWINGLRRCPSLPGEQRIPYYMGFALAIWAVSLVATAVGYHATGAFPPAVALGLVFFNPLYFLLIPFVGMKSNMRLFAVLMGSVLGPLFHLATPDWGLLLTGVIGGTAAFVAARAISRRRRAPLESGEGV